MVYILVNKVFLQLSIQILWLITINYLHYLIFKPKQIIKFITLFGINLGNQNCIPTILKQTVFHLVQYFRFLSNK